MNTISSLLKFLGNTLGANPTTTLTTTSKTLVGAINEVDADISAIADYVVEQGTSGDASYRKWNSGILECWIYTTKNVAINTAMNNIYIGTWYWTFPVAFIDLPTVICSQFKWGTSASWGGVVGVSTTRASLEGYDVYSRASGSTSISAYAIGKWK